MSSATPRSCGPRPGALARPEAPRRPGRRHHGRCARRRRHLVDGFDGAHARLPRRSSRAATTAAPSASSPSAAAPAAACRCRADRRRRRGRWSRTATASSSSPASTSPPTARTCRASRASAPCCADLLAAVPELRRLRLSSLDPAEIDPELSDLVADEPRLMPHLHLSVQAGRRPGAQADEAAAPAGRRDPARRAPARAAARPRVRGRPDRGLPDRGRGDVRATRCDLVEEAGLTYLHVFPYSPRPGTPAARMPQLADGACARSARRGCGRRGEAALGAVPRGAGRASGGGR